LKSSARFCLVQKQEPALIQNYHNKQLCRKEEYKILLNSALCEDSVGKLHHRVCYGRHAQLAREPGFLKKPHQVSTEKIEQSASRPV
jgi:hypothetical protein